MINQLCNNHKTPNITVLVNCSEDKKWMIIQHIACVCHLPCLPIHFKWCITEVKACKTSELELVFECKECWAQLGLLCAYSWQC